LSDFHSQSFKGLLSTVRIWAVDGLGGFAMEARSETNLNLVADSKTSTQQENRNSANCKTAMLKGN